MYFTHETNDWEWQPWLRYPYAGISVYIQFAAIFFLGVPQLIEIPDIFALMEWTQEISQQKNSDCLIRGPWGSLQKKKTFDE